MSAPTNVPMDVDAMQTMGLREASTSETVSAQGCCITAGPAQQQRSVMVC